MNTGFHNAEIALDNKVREAGQQMDNKLQQGAENVQVTLGNIAKNTHDSANQQKQQLQVILFIYLLCFE